MTATSRALKKAEIKTRTTDDIKMRAKDVYAHWGLTLNDAINMFLVKSIEVGGLPFNLRIEDPSYEDLSAIAYKPAVNSDGMMILPADWDDGDE